MQEKQVVVSYYFYVSSHKNIIQISAYNLHSAEVKWYIIITYDISQYFGMDGSTLLTWVDMTVRPNAVRGQIIANLPAKTHMNRRPGAPIDINWIHLIPNMDK